MCPSPARGQRFRLLDRALDLATGAATFDYELDGERFTERVGLPAGAREPDSAALDLLLDVAHAAIGTSYYKLTAPRELAVERPVGQTVAGLIRQIYDDGLRELAVTNGLPVPLTTDLIADVVADHPVTSAGGDPVRPLAPIGGGKDSAAVLSLLPGATGVTITATPAQRRLTDAAGVELLEVTRTLDARLAERTAAGGMNGHIPITAVNSALASIVALLHGHDAVVFGNERSANEPTRVVDGTPVNHQHSKSFAFEAAFAAAVAPAGVTYFSLLRRLSGLSVAGLVVADGTLLGSFLSCNRAFKRSRADDEPQTWCLECPKCLSTFLLFACFLSPLEAEAAFGGNPLAVPARTEGFAELWDAEAKPFECVAELAESAVAMAWLGEVDDWRTHAVVGSLAHRAGTTARSLDATMEGMLRPDGEHLVPGDLAAAVERAAAALRPRR
jgi:hypothetical protein